MRTLVIDTATHACSVALFDGACVVASHYEVIKRGHAERLLPLIANLPERGRADQIKVNVGPGSFTGIRVGVAAARALGLAWGLPVSGYGCLTLVAAMARAGQLSPVDIDVIMSDDHDEFFFQSFNETGVAQSDAVSLTPVALAHQSTSSIVASDVTSTLEPLLFDRVFVDTMPDAASWHLISQCASLPASPVYGRAPDAKLSRGLAA